MQPCAAYYKQGFCVNGEFCTKLHAHDAVAIREHEFLNFWQNMEDYWHIGI